MIHLVLNVFFALIEPALESLGEFLVAVVAIAALVGLLSLVPPSAAPCCVPCPAVGAATAAPSTPHLEKAISP